MQHALLAIDLGNTTCHMAWVQKRAAEWSVETLLRTPRAEGTIQALRGWLASNPVESGTRAAVASVAHPAETDAVVALLNETCGQALCVEPPAGLVLRLEDASGVGCDRLYAARAALELTGQSTVVVDAGTALTVDVVRALGGSDDASPCGEFLGGAIAPGPRLLAQALAQEAARLPRVEARPGVVALGRDTQCALQAGVAVGFEGAALRLIERVSVEAGLPSPALVLTGGAAHFLSEVLGREAQGALHEDPDLVVRGLALSAWEHLGRQP